MRLLRLRLLAMFSAVVLLAPLAGAQAASGHVTAPRNMTQARQGGATDAGAADPSVPGPDQPTSPLVPLRDGGTADATAMAAASAQARSTGKPERVNKLTTSTSITVAEPHGGFAFQESVLPLRVRRGNGWVPVDTSLRRKADGTFSPAAVPGDTVTFSGGGTRPLATISSGTASLQVSWPGRLPAPVLSGSSLTYRDVLPGVNLVLTATAGVSGGFSEILVVKDAAAARDPGLRRLALGVAGRRAAPVTTAPGGGLVVRSSGAPVEYTAAPPVMWDSSSARPGSPSMATAARSARKVGGWAAPPGLSPASSPAGPASGAAVARVRDALTAGHRGVALVPDQAMLTSRSTRFPVFIDPTWTQDTTNTQHYDEVQSACPTASNYDTTDSAYWSLGAGYDGYGDCNGVNGTAYAYYQVYVPTRIYGAYIHSATVDAQEAYSASCSASGSVTLSQTARISSGTNWNNKPDPMNNLSTVNVGPAPQSCNGTYSTSPSNWIGVGFDVTSTIQTAAKQQWTNLTFRLWQQNSPPSTSWKRFGKNPTLYIQYNQAPSQPSALQVAGGTGATSQPCTTDTSQYPIVGKLSSTDSTVLSANVSDKDGDSVFGQFTYWVNGSSSKTTLPNTAYTTSGTVRADIPASVTNGMTNGTQIDWTVTSGDGFTSAEDGFSPVSSTCYFTVDPQAPTAPTVTPGFSSSPAAGSSVTFTVASNDPASDPATQLVWELDTQPSTTSPSASQVVKLASGQTSASVTLTVASPGPHAFYVYAEDAAGNVSTAGAATFTATADPGQTFGSFAAALAAGQSFDNEMISSSSTSSGTANADGWNFSLGEQDLKNAGWSPGGKLTVDGATFTLPAFGSGGPDNLLAANQTISLPAGSQGSSLVILATATSSSGSAPDAADETPVQLQTVPYTPGGTPVAGLECDGYQQGQPGTCTVPSGAISYVNGGAAPESYSLTAPDWVNGPAGPAALQLPERMSATGTNGHTPQIYAFAVPLNPSVPVASVTLPDVGSAIFAGGHAIPALHILGIAVANTTTATPGGPALPAGQAWTGAWASPTEGDDAPPASTGWKTYGNQTFRIALTASAGGSAVRLRLSNDLGWLAGSSGAPLTLGAVTVAPQGSGPALAGSATAVTFGGSASVSIPEGGDVYSDPVSLPVTAGEHLTASIYLSNTVKYLVQHTLCSACTEYIAAGNQATNTTGSPFTGSGTLSGQFSNILIGADVQTAGLPTAAVAGNNVVDAANPAAKVVAQAPRIADNLAAGEAAQAGGPTFGVVDEGIEANDLLVSQDSATGTSGGPSVLDRLGSEILAEPGVGTVVVDGGLEDVLQGAAAPDLATGYTVLQTQLQSWGITQIFTTLTPCGGYAGYGSTPDSCSTAAEDNRTAANNSIATNFSSPFPAPCLTAPSSACTFADDFSAALWDGNAASPEQDLIAADNSGDGVNLTGAGYAAAVATIPLSQLTAVSPPAD